MSWKEVAYNRRGTLTILCAILALSSIWSFISVMRYDAFNADVLDLGVNSSLLYGVFHPDFSSGNLAVNKLIYLLIAPFYNLYPDPRTLLVFQSFWISIGAFPLYKIGKKVLGDEFASVAMSLAYLVYFPLGGVYWFDFHYMALFPTFFLFGIMFLVYERKRYLLLFMFLATLTDLLVPIIMLFMGVCYMLYPSKRKRDPLITRYILVALLFSFAVLVLIALYFGPAYIYNWMNRPFSAGFFSSLSADLPLKAEYFFWLLLPVLFLSFLEIRILLLIIPYVLFVFSYSYHPFYSPMFYQYPALTAPIIFTSAVYGMRKFKKIPSFRRLKAKHLAAAILLINILLASLLSPLGNIATGINDGYNAPNQITVTNQDNALNQMISLIPKGSTVLIQGNMPQLTNGYHWILPYQLNHTDLPQYALSDPYSYYYFDGVHISGNVISNFQSEFQSLLNSGRYHIVDNEYNITLIEKNS
ncbi:hypothetical protein IX51_03930 [uncultured archaeon]|nr:hypothetical protein IX51_03930 [uncultured archaeon]